MLIRMQDPILSYLLSHLQHHYLTHITLLIPSSSFLLFHLYQRKTQSYTEKNIINIKREQQEPSPLGRKLKLGILSPKTQMFDSPLQLIALQTGQSPRNPSKNKNKQGSKNRAEIDISRYMSKSALTYSPRAFLTQQKHNITTFTRCKCHYGQPQPTAFSHPTQKLLFPASQPDPHGLSEIITTAQA